MRSNPAAVRVLVCEGSPGDTRSLASLLARGPELEVIGACAPGEEAARALHRLDPDLVVVDLELPGMAGLRVVEAVMRTRPVPVVGLSTHVGRGSEKAAAAMAAGAVEVVAMSQLRVDDPDGAAAVMLRHRLRRLARAPLARQTRPRAKPPASVRAKRPKRASAIGICASTGGPGALATVLSDLPASFPLPVLVVQHMADGFIDSLAGWLAERAPLPVAVVRGTTRLRPGIWFAPDDAHLALESPTHLGVDDQAPRGLHVPSADVLLSSMAAHLGSGAVAVVLTGMGRDGGRGVADIIRAGGRVIAQDEETSVVFGMPKIAIEQGADVVLPLGKIASALSQLVVKEAVA
jgi:two-component system, chemotaxis family, protein-glutamate methylesterase/glutaminase